MSPTSPVFPPSSIRFINLLMNAIDALAPGGNLWLSLDHDGPEVCVTVRDDGAGIAPEILPHVFEPFVTTKAAGLGTGLGLAISQAIVARHGGRIAAATGATGGATFTVRLPVPATAVATEDRGSVAKSLPSSSTW